MSELLGSEEVVPLEALHRATGGRQGRQGCFGRLAGERLEAWVRCADSVRWGGRCEVAAIST